MSLQSKLNAWRQDPAAWAEENLVLTDPSTGRKGPLRLYDHQKAWLREATKRNAEGGFQYKVAVASRPKREAKTTDVAILCTWRMTCWSDQRLAVIANSERQAASNVFDAVAKFFRDSPTLRTLAPEPTRGRLEVPSLNNTLATYPDNPATIQGTGFSCVACDELHASDSGGKTYAFASMQCDGPNAQVLICSQAGAPVSSNPLWVLYQARAQKHIFFDYRQDLVTPWAKQRAEEAKAELLPGEYDFMFRNCWGATGFRLFATPDVERACWPYRQPQTPGQWQALVESWGLAGVPCVVGVGLDRAGVGRGGDRTAWVVCARFSQRQGDVFRIARVSVLPTGSEAEILEEQRRTEAIFGRPRRSLFESYNASDVVEKVPGATLETASSLRQADLFSRMHRLLQEGRLAFPEECALLKEELVAAEYSCERGTTRYCTQRGHDDTVYGAAWALAAADGPAEAAPMQFGPTGITYGMNRDTEGSSYAQRMRQAQAGGVTFGGNR